MSRTGILTREGAALWNDVDLLVRPDRPPLGRGMTASIALHLACGFREVGRRERIGKMNGQWRDTLLFERRSSRIG